MKRKTHSQHKSSKKRIPTPEVISDKASIIREATRITLDQYSKTFEDLARYDRTEKARS